MKRNNLIIFAIALPLILIASCRKPKGNAVQDADMVKKEVLNQLAANVIGDTYKKLKLASTTMRLRILQLDSFTTENNVTACRNAWLETREAWESSEGFLFGPVATNNIDPRIDTWPVNYVALDSVLAKNTVYTTAFIESLEDALRGFHPIEYLLYGKVGTKTAAEFTNSEKKYLIGLAENLDGLCAQLYGEWSADFATKFTSPGINSPYPTRLEVYEEIVNAMVGICDEVANGKIKEPFDNKDPSLEESPFSGNSIMDFINNMHSVQNMYTGKYILDGMGMEDFVKLYNLSLHNKIQQKIQAAITSLQNITVPFGKAITTQTTQVQNAIDAIQDLKEELEDDLLPLVQLHAI